MENFDLLSIGDATLDAFMIPTESETLCRIDTKECFIAFSYGEKIPVKNLEFSIGGNAANNAIGVKRLGVNVGIVLTLGDDSIGNLIIERLKNEGVNLTYVIQQPGTGSNYSSVINYQGERTIFTYHAPRSYEFPVQLPKAPWVYLTSMGESFRPFYNHMVEWLTKNPEVKLAFNPGSWQMRSENGKDKKLLQALSTLGPKICVVTDGGKGAFASNGQTFFKVGVLPVDAYERT